ncbi:MAG TPA: hypothetical protein VFU09_08810 [Candidatus Udaeobacter sp.]|nr:hypothetical protein [Candidatus Udaeobacter sp.]
MTNQTTIDVFMEAVEHGLKLSFKPPFTLCVDPAERCPSDFVDTLSQHETRLLALLQLPFIMAFSRMLGETVFLCEDDETRQALIEAGVPSDAIYTRDELEILIAHNRARPFIPAELIKLHEIKTTFQARITE